MKITIRQRIKALWPGLLLWFCGLLPLSYGIYRMWMGDGTSIAARGFFSGVAVCGAGLVWTMYLAKQKGIPLNRNTDQ